MGDQRSPCIQCEHLGDNKRECAAGCEKLEAFQENLSQFSPWRGEQISYGIPGMERKPIYRLYE
jgi:hypothetical protein